MVTPICTVKKVSEIFHKKSGSILVTTLRKKLRSKERKIFIQTTRIFSGNRKNFFINQHLESTYFSCFQEIFPVLTEIVHYEKKNFFSVLTEIVQVYKKNFRRKGFIFSPYSRNISGLERNNSYVKTRNFSVLTEIFQVLFNHFLFFPDPPYVEKKKR